MAIIYKSTAPTYVDNRPASYKKIASRSASKRLAAAKQKAEEQSQTKIAISNDNIVRSDTSSQVAISGNPSNNLVRTNVTTTPEPIIASPLPQVSPNNAYTVALQGRPVSVSPGVASKLAQQSIRQDQTYTVSTKNNRIRASVYKEAILPSTTENKRTVNDRIRAGYEASPLYTFVEGVKYAFTKPATESDLFENPNREQILAKEAVGKQGFAMILTGAAVGMTAEPTMLKPGKVDVKIKSAVTQQASEKMIINKANIVEGSEVVAYPKWYIKPFVSAQKYEIAGRTREVGTITESVGLQSKESIINTKAGSRLFLKPVASKPVGPGQKVSSFITKQTDKVFGKDQQPLTIVRSESVGNEVGGVGQRKTSLTISNRARQLKTDSFVESYVGQNEGEVIFGGSVSKRGSNFYTGRLVLDLPESNIKGYEVFTAGQSEVPRSAAFTRAGVRSTLLKEKTGYVLDGVEPGFVNPVAREQASASSTVQLLNVRGGSSIVSSQQQVVKSAVGEIGLGKVPGGSQANIGQVVLTSKSTKNKTSTAKTSSASAQSSFYSQNYVLSNVQSSFTERRGVSKLSSALGQQSISRFGSLGSTRSTTESIQSSLNKQSNDTFTEVKPLQVQAQAQNQLQGQKLKSVTSKSSIGNSFSVSPKSSLPFGLKVNLPKKNSGGVYVVDVRRRGVFRKVGVFSTLSGAVKGGVGKVKGGLGATFRVRKGDKVLKISSPSKEFYSKSSGEVVQKRGFRLSSRGEVVEIGFENRRSGNRRGLF